ncbi:MAG: hypothetical protein L3J91_04030 [Thermoplasmata archaeon]|nr:hypothetical protein [Thermoplasmata archaeon]
MAVAYSLLLALGAIPAEPVPSAGAFAVVGLVLFAWVWTDPEWAPAPRPRPEPAPLPRRRPTPEPHGGPVPSLNLPRARRASSPGLAPSLTAPISSGDLLWARLARDPGGVLPVDLVPPTAESAFDSLPGESFPEMPGGGAEWDAGADEGALAPSWGAPALLGSPTWTPTEHEALNHTPPHLRSSPPGWKEVIGPRPTPPTRPTPEGPHCASCQRPLANPPAWRACTACHRPFCGECAFRSRRKMGAGQCLSCRSRAAIDEPRFVA